MGKSLKEKAVMATLGVIVLYAIAVGVWFFSAERSWKLSAKRFNDAKIKYQKEVRLIGEKQKWDDAYEAEKAAMPTFEEGRATDTTWRRKLDELAAKHHVVIASAQTGKEITIESGNDTLGELPIEVRSWESSLEALVRLMHELENTTEGMFDITQISLKPSSKRGYLRGSFTLNCAYMREK